MQPQTIKGSDPLIKGLTPKGVTEGALARRAPMRIKLMLAAALAAAVAVSASAAGAPNRRPRAPPRSDRS